MNKSNMIKTVAVLMMVTIALTLTTAASDWSQFQKDEVNIGRTADSAPITALDDMTIGDVQPALQGAAVPDEGTELENDGGNFLVLSDWTRYDFDVGAGTDKWAYEGELSGTPATANDPTGAIGSYSNIRADDGTYETYITSTNGKYAAQRFNFSIDDNEESWITKINVTWKGIGKHDILTDGAKLYIYNFTSKAYEHLQTSANVETEETLTGEKTASRNYISSSNNVTVLVNQTSAQTTGPPPQNPKYYSHIATDYVKLVVTP